MNANNANIYIDIILGITEFLLLSAYFVKTDNYETFRFSYYYYLIIAPCFGLLEFIKIIFSTQSNIDIDRIDIAESELPMNRKSQILQLFQLSFASLFLMLPTLIELIIGAVSTLVKYALTKDVSANDLYVIHFTPAFLSVIPLCLKEIKGLSLDNILDNTQKTYIFFCTLPFTLIGITINTLVLISGGLIGLNICNNYLIN